MAFKFSKLFSRATESPDPQPSSAKVNFKRPMSLEERVQQAVRSEMLARQFQLNQKADFSGFDDVEQPEFESEHELTVDQTTGEEVTKAQLSSRQQARAEFDHYVAQVKEKAAKKLPKKSAKQDPPEEVDP